MGMRSNTMEKTTIINGKQSLPFQLLIIEDRNHIPITDLTTSTKSIPNCIYRVKEWSHLEIEFISDESQSVDIKWGVVSQDEFELSFHLDAGKRMHLLYEQSGKQTFPWRCGFYHFEVVYKGKKYYGGFEVYPRTVTRIQFAQMHKWINHHLEGLATDYLHYTKTYSNLSAIEESGHWHFINWYIDHEKQLYQSITAIEQNSKHELERKYAIENEPKHIDHRSIRWQATAKGQALKGIKYMNRKMILSWDTEANQIVKYRMMQLLQKMDDVLSFLMDMDDNAYHYFVRAEKEETDLAEKLTQIKEINRVTDKEKKRASAALTAKKMEKKKLQRQSDRMRHTLDRFTKSRQLLSNRIHADFWKRVTNRFPKRAAIGQNAAYRLFHQLWVSFETLYNNDQKNEMKTPVYKPTPTLYEYYIYFGVIRLIQSLGFEPEKSSVEEQLMSTFFENGLMDGTKVSLVKEDMKLDMVYDEMIEYSEQAALANGTNFFSGGTHRKPDIRMDCYVMEGESWKYKSSFIIEVKYRPFINIFNRNGSTDTMEQMMEYWNIKHVEKSSGRPDYNHKPIEYVVCVYPGAQDQALVEEAGAGRFLQYYPNPNSKDMFDIVGKDQLKELLQEWLD